MLRAHIEAARGGATIAADLEVPRERRLVIVGPNGAGKSTVIGALAGIVPLTSGRIELDDRVLDDTTTDTHVEPRDRHVGVVFQGGVLFPHMTVEDNVAFGARARGSPASKAADRARIELERFDLVPLAGKRPDELSGGEAQRVALARALASDPVLLLLDEPFASLDVSSRVDVRRAVQRALDESPAVAIVVTHDPVEALALGDTILVMEDGRVSQSGTPDQIRSRPRSSYVGDLVGLNVLRGSAAGGRVTLAEGMSLTIADDVEGPVIVTFHPHAVSLHDARPEGSMRNVWETSLRHVEHLGGRVRVELGSPAGCAVEVTEMAAGEMDLRPGRSVWASLKATEVTCSPD